jgi:polar amino acid transport system substrate-binding protein
MLKIRSAAAAVIVLLVAACSSNGAATTAPTTPSATTAPITAAPATAAPTEVPIAPPTSLLTPGTIVDCVDIEYSPMEYFDTGETDPNKAIGFDVDSAKAVAAKLGLQIQIRNTAFDALIPDLTAGRCDIVWTALYVSEKRLAVADAVPYMATGQVVMAPKANVKGINSLDSLCGLTVAIQSAGLVEQRINDQSKACTDAGKSAISIQGYKTVAEEFQQIVKGSVDAIWETDTGVSDFMLKNPDQYVVAYALPKDDNYGVYFNKNHDDIKAALTAAIAALKADGSLATIADKYQIDKATLDVVVK